MTFTIAEFLYLSIWSFLGSFLGFFAFGYTPHKPPQENFCRGALSLGVGFFIAFAVFSYLEEFHKYSRHFNITIGGLCAFGLPDFIMKWWPRLMRAVASRIVDKAIGDGVKCPSDWTEDKDKDKETDKPNKDSEGTD